jgi:prevent-host-death family protein
MRIGLREANQQFSKAIRAVKAGREVVLTERGKPVAVIKPIPRSESEDDVLRRLEAVGLLRAARRRGMPEWKPLRITGLSLSQAVREERDTD